LIVDNLEALITELGGTPNNTSSTQLAALFSAAKLMERIKSVDGEQSGLDAGKLAGHPGNYYAPVNSPTLTGTPMAPTAEPETNNTQIATTAFVMAALSALVNSSPEALDTLNELAAALGNDADFATTITNALALKAPLASPALTGTPTAPTAAAATNNTQVATTAFVQGVVGDGIKSVARGFMSLGLTNTNNSSAPQIAAGSQVEVGGSVYTCQANTSVNETPQNNQVNYIYVSVDGSTIIFSYGTTTPAWNVSKGGWYNSNYRAVAKLFLTSSQYNGKVILDSYNAMQLLNVEQTVPTTGGMLFVTGTVNQVKSITLPAGAYRYEVKAGTGGRGGNNDNHTGGAGAAGEQKSGTFMLAQQLMIHYALGGDGNNGVDTSAAAGAGGGCSGGSAFIDFGTELILCLGGSGGGGSGRDTNGESGGGGAGGYGTASDGTGVYGGKGGSNGTGGNGGGDERYSGGGGSGYLAGGKGTSGAQSGYGGQDGGGYGESGGKGGGGYGAGGTSATGEGVVTATEKYTMKIQYQGGGGGDGSAGGGGLKSTSSGYLRIYRMW
jgi:hypothetical protein